jgi:hypothetical protein
VAPEIAKPSINFLYASGEAPKSANILLERILFRPPRFFALVTVHKPIIASYATWELDLCAADPPAKLKRLGVAFRGTTKVEKNLKLTLTCRLRPQFEKFASEMREVSTHPEWISG